MEKLYEFLDGELTPDVNEQIRAHLAECRGCFPHFEYERVFLRFMEKRAVIERAGADARQAGGTPVVVTFDPHPVRVLRPEKAPRECTMKQVRRENESPRGARARSAPPVPSRRSSLERWR